MQIQRVMAPPDNLTMKYHKKVTDCNLRVQKLKNNLLSIKSDVSKETLNQGKKFHLLK